MQNRYSDIQKEECGVGIIGIGYHSQAIITAIRQQYRVPLPFSYFAIDSQFDQPQAAPSNEPYINQAPLSDLIDAPTQQSLERWIAKRDILFMISGLESEVTTALHTTIADQFCHLTPDPEQDNFFICTITISGVKSEVRSEFPLIRDPFIVSIIIEPEAEADSPVFQQRIIRIKQVSNCTIVSPASLIRRHLLVEQPADNTAGYWSCQYQAISYIPYGIMGPLSLVGVDFNDLRKALISGCEIKVVLVSVGGENRAQRAVEQACA